MIIKKFKGKVEEYKEKVKEKMKINSREKRQEKINDHVIAINELFY